jgi:signal transduction histidine kinase
VEVGSLQPSGRVIASGRLLLASLFLIALWADRSQPANSPIFLLLDFYVVSSLAVTLLVWNNWWLDARLAAPAHVIDVAVFMVMLYSTEGYTSPYFIFFIFILLAAAIRWGWRETAVTAAAIVAIYLAAGLMLGPSPQFEIERFIIRTGHLLILSAILIWFGSSQWVAWPRLEKAGAAVGPIGGDSFVAALEAAMTALGARRGMLLWRESADDQMEILSVSGEGARRSVAVSGTAMPHLAGPTLFDLARDRALMRADASQWRFLSASATLPSTLRQLVEDRQGLAVPIVTGAAEGVAVFQDVRVLCTDQLDYGPRLARDMAAWLQSAAMLTALEERSMAKARAVVARDLHDSVVQFLAGLGFRLEALNRSPAVKGDVARNITEIKEMVMAEQGLLRAFIGALRTGGSVPLSDLASDCATLCRRLAEQWNIDCAFNSQAESGSIPVRLQLDVQQLVREAVANAVRHGGARHVAVSLRSERYHFCLTVADDGRGFTPPATPDGEVKPPASLSGRVREARGELTVHSKAGETSIFIRLPMEAAA